MKRIIPLAVALALIAAACGGGDSADTTVTTVATTTTVAPATTTTTVPVTTTTSSTTTFPVNPKLSGSDVVTTAGLGPIRIGMNPLEANEAAGYQLEIDFVDNACYYLMAAPVLDGVGFMVTGDTIARVDIFGGSNITTRSGARIGMTEAQIINLFGDKIETSANVEGGKYLTFVPVDEDDKNFRVIFETNENGIVTTYRSGRLPEVGWVEGCA